MMLELQKKQNSAGYCKMHPSRSRGPCSAVVLKMKRLGNASKKPGEGLDQPAVHDSHLPLNFIFHLELGARV